MKQSKTPTTKGKEYIIVENVSDHVGYNGEPVTVVKELPENYYLVRNKDGTEWQVGEEEIKPTEGKPLPSFKTLHIGLATDDEDCQLINELGEEILIIKSYPLKENAELIIKAVNERQALLDSRQELAKALQDIKNRYAICLGSLDDATKEDYEAIETAEQVLKEAGLTNE